MLILINLGVEAAKRTFTPEDLGKVLDLVKLRPIQFCKFLKALVGMEEVQRMMIEAIGVAKQQEQSKRAAALTAGPLRRLKQ